MKIRRLAALVSAAVLALGMVTAVPATATECEQPPAGADFQTEWTCEPSSQPTDDQCQNEQGQPVECASEEPSSEPAKEPSTAPTDEEEDGSVKGETSKPTLPPTDTLTSTSTSGPDGTLPLVLIVLGVVGLAAVVLTPARAKR